MTRLTFAASPPVLGACLVKLSPYYALLTSRMLIILEYSDLCYSFVHRVQLLCNICRVGQNHIHTVYVTLNGRGFTKYSVIYGVYIRLWPLLLMWQAPSDPALTCKQECTEIKNTSSPFRSCTHACAGTHMQGCTNIHTQARTHHSDPAHTCTQGGIRSNRCTLARTIQILHSRMRRDALTFTHKHAPYRSCTCAPALTCTQGCRCTNRYTQARTI